MEPPTNKIFRPDPKSLTLEAIPVWEESFVETLGPQLTRRLAYDPAGEALPVISDLSGCDAQFCEELAQGELKELWGTYYTKDAGLDGIFKTARRDGEFDYYFYRHGIHEWDPFLCRGENKTLPVSLKRSEAIVLELWTPLRQSNFQACDVSGKAVSGEAGELTYVADLSENEILPTLREDLQKLALALDWQAKHPEESENPWNPRQFPLDISSEKVGALQGHFSDVVWKDRWLWVGGGALGLVVPFWLGIGFHYGPVVARHLLQFFSGGANLLPLFIFPGQEELLTLDLQLSPHSL